MYFIVENLLGAQELARVQSLIGDAKFIDGKATANLAKSRKHNLEMEVGESYANVAELLNSAVDQSSKLNMRLIPRFRSQPIVSRYDAGMFFTEHIDAPIQGRITQVGRSPGRFGQNFVRTDYSMTLFLGNPGSYDGGELELRVFEDTKLIKLQAGSAVCYSTGIPHSVRPITRGERFAAIYWFQSLIRDVQIRRLHWDLYVLEEKLQQNGQRDFAEQAASIRNNLLRYTADV
jgi:PKHD-type hydroxylase